MNLAVVIEGHMSRTPDGAVWTGRPFNYSFWERYLEVFEHVNVVIRLQSKDRVPEDWKRADGKGVSFRALPDYVGPMQYLRKMRQVRTALREAIKEPEAVILRVPGVSGTVAMNHLLATGHPYAAEVVTDPFDMFAPDVTRHPLRPLLRAWFTRDLRRVVAKADAVSYVTEQALQRRYPPRPDVFTTHYSSVTLGDEGYVTAPRPVDPNQHSFTIIYVGTLAQLYKAPYVLIDALSQCISEGLDVRLLIVGGGLYQAHLEAQASNLGIRDRVQFLGQLPTGEAVRSQLDQSDLFVLPSKAEGLPRAMIEAMARGLPCIGTTVAGIPELLPPEDMVPPGDSAALANKISQVLRDPERRARMAARNLAKTQAYHRTILQERRNAFYRATREVTESWLKTRSSARQVDDLPAR